MEENKIRQYNVKGFLAPNSIKSMASYHAKIMPDGTYMFRLHDCNNGVRLIGNVTDPADVLEAIEKFSELEQAVRDFADFIMDNYLNN